MPAEGWHDQEGRIIQNNYKKWIYASFNSFKKNSTLYYTIGYTIYTILYYIAIY